MKTKRLMICIAMMAASRVVFSCMSYGESPREYIVYRVCNKPTDDGAVFSYMPDYQQRNLEAWAAETGFNGDLHDIEKVVYMYSLDELVDLHENGTFPKWDRDNEWTACAGTHNPYSAYLVIAKQCEIARAGQTDPWYYPADRQHGFTTLDALLDRINDVGTNLKDRYNLQRTRLLFSLGRYNECVNLWNNHVRQLPDNNLMKSMIKDYIAGAYCHLGDTATAKKMYIEQGNYWEAARLSHAHNTCWADVIKAVYNIDPDCNDMVAYNMQVELEYFYAGYNLNVKKLQKYRDVMTYITRTHRSKDMALWYYTKAYVEEKLGNLNAAAASIAAAERCKTTEFLHRNIRLFRMYIDAKTLPVNDNYERKLYTDLCWLDTLIKNNISDDVRTLLQEEEADMYHWHKMWYCYSFYYYNDMMRKIILGEAAPRLMQAGRKTRAVQLYNYADNVLFQQVIPQASHCFLNYFFGCMYHDCSGREIEAYIHRTLHPQSDFDRLLNTGSYIDTDYLYDIAGTVYLREQNYAKALECLSKVSNTYQEKLHTAEYMHTDPFCADMYTGYMWGKYPFTDYKYNFAREMCSLEQVMNNKNIDINRRASAKLRFAIGLRNSYFSAWPLTRYSVGYPVFAHSFEEWMNSKRENDILRRYEQLRDEAFAMFDDDETAAAAHYKFRNNLTIVRQYPQTQTAQYVRGHCDTYFDYHLDCARKMFTAEYDVSLPWNGRIMH